MKHYKSPSKKCACKLFLPYPKADAYMPHHLKVRYIPEPMSEDGVDCGVPPHKEISLPPKRSIPDCKNNLSVRLVSN